MNLMDKFYSIFLEKAYESDVCYNLAAGIVLNNKLLSKPCCNSNRSYFRRAYCNSLHAEAHAILNFYGKNLKFDVLQDRWYLKYCKWKKTKKS